MRLRGQIVAAVLLIAPAYSVTVAQTVDLSPLYRIKQEAFQNSQVMDHLFYLTDVYGPRLTGSPGYRQAAEWAAQAGVMLALENVDVPLTESLSRCMALVRQVNSLWFQAYPDMANVAAAGYDPVVELAHCAGHIVAIHVKDSLPRTIRRVPFGAGIVPFAPVFRTLAGQGYRGPLVVEMWADTPGVSDPLQAAREARRFVAGLVEQTYS